MAADGQNNTQVLADAIARNAAVVVSLPSAGMIRNYKTRFIGEDELGIWIETPPEARTLVQELQAHARPLAVSFHANHRRVSFASSVVKMEESFQVNSSMAVMAFQVTPAQEIKAVQRRSAYRVRVPDDSDLSVRFFRIPDHAHINDRPPPSQQVEMQVRDVSVGGLGVTIMEQPTGQHKLAANQRLRVEVNYEDIELVLDGRLRYEEASNNVPNQAGIVFKKLEGDVEGRQTLAAITKIVGELSRTEVRRMRRTG